MIKHIVQWRLKEDSEGKSKAINAQKAKQMLEAKAPVWNWLNKGSNFTGIQNGNGQKK